MCDALVWSFDAITGLPWLELIKALAPIATAVIAFYALRNWKKQEKAKRQAEFLDKLLEAVHEYVVLMPRAIGIAQETAGMIVDVREMPGGPNPEELAFFDKKQSDNVKLLSEQLERIRPYYIKVSTLVAKGKVFRFDEYENCKNSVRTLTAQFLKIQRVRLIGPIGELSLNQPDVGIAETVEVANEDFRRLMREHTQAVVDYVEEAYSRIYK